MDIVIYMREEDFRHKTDEVSYLFWSMGRAPKNFKIGEKIYFACAFGGNMENCSVVGYVICEEFNPGDLGGETLVWYGGSYLSLQTQIPCKPFRGFRYKWWD